MHLLIEHVAQGTFVAEATPKSGNPFQGTSDIQLAYWISNVSLGGLSLALSKDAQPDVVRLMKKNVTAAPPFP
ncbi:hypothetical protein [Phaffia rhodozyma]|uniref:Uncharacterized protein n=1 Tax=Phaffia rhodozyma TaxID=264483 RepID=A0A0F7SPB9_PHARH|nr:hypothetical protein [Phaffia rhodozyma]